MEQITFLSLQGNTLNSDIREIQEMIRSNYPECRFALMAHNFDISEKDKIKKKKIAVKKYLKEAECIFSIDGATSLSDWSNGYQAKKRILLLAPFDYLYKGIDNKAYLNKLMRGFTDVIVPGADLTEYIAKNCNVSGINIHGNVELPYINSLKDVECIKAERAEFDEKFPWAKGKQLIVLLTNGLRPNQKPIFEDVRVKSIIENLPENTVFVTNNETLFATSMELNKKEKQCFVFVRRLFRRNQLARMADCLITDDSYLWSCHASVDRNVHYYPYRKSYFMKYAKKNLQNNIINDLPLQICEVMKSQGNGNGITFDGTIMIEDVLKKILPCQNC